VCLDIPKANGILASRLFARKLSKTWLILLGAASRNTEDEHMNMSASDVLHCFTSRGMAQMIDMKWEISLEKEIIT
jgi:hypothetical protein